MAPRAPAEQPLYSTCVPGADPSPPHAMSSRKTADTTSAPRKLKPKDCSSAVMFPESEGSGGANRVGGQADQRAALRGMHCSQRGRVGRRTPYAPLLAPPARFATHKRRSCSTPREPGWRRAGVHRLLQALPPRPTSPSTSSSYADRTTASCTMSHRSTTLHLLWRWARAEALFAHTAVAAALQRRTYAYLLGGRSTP